MSNIRTIIITTLSSFDINFNECLVADIEIEVRRRAHTNSEGLAHAISRNKASDIVRKRLRAKKRMTAKLLRQEKEQQEQELLNRLKKEFVSMEPGIVAGVSRTAKRGAKRNIDLCYLRVMDNLHIFEIQKRFYPELSGVVIRKGIQRGRELFLQRGISAELREKLTPTRR